MKIQTTADALRRGMEAIAPVIERRTKVPVLRCIHIDGRTLTGTDLDMWVSVQLPLAERSRGKAVVDHRSLYNLVRHIDRDDEITLSVENGAAKVEFNGAKYSAYHVPPDDFPAEQTIDETHQTAAGNLNVIDAMRSVAFAVSSEETRYHFNGVCLDMNNKGGPVAVSTDGHRLAVKPLAAPVALAKGWQRPIVPRKAVQFLTGQSGEPNMITAAEHAWHWRFDGGMSVRTKLIDGTFPDWRRVMPGDEAEPYLTVDRLKLLKIVRRICAFCTGNGQRSIGIKLIVDPAGVLELSGVRDFDKEQRFVERMDCESPRQTEVTLGFDGHYLIDVLEAYSGCQNITFRSKEPAFEPTRFESPDTDLSVVLMPMRV